MPKKTRLFIPDRGDIILIDNHRPALVLSPIKYNTRTGLAIMCQITAQCLDYPFEVRCEVAGSGSAILSDHLRLLDWQAHEAKLIGKIDNLVLATVQGKVVELITGQF